MQPHPDAEPDAEPVQLVPAVFATAADGVAAALDAQRALDAAT